MRKENYTLLIMAAGMGSRFGGLKQIEPFGPNGEFIIDYSIYDAIKAGFNKIVFIIKKENLDIFKETIGKRIEQHVKVEYVFQELNDLPKGFSKPKDRIKPWGTGQAILAAKNVIHEPFAVINSDDFYGYDAYVKLIDYLKNIPKSDKNQYSLVSYLVRETLSENGAVKRGICKIDNNKLVDITESNIKVEKNEITANPLNTDLHYKLEDDALAAVNMFGLEPSIFDYLEKEFNLFLDKNLNNLNSEFLIPEILAKGIKNNICDINIIKTTAKWYGVTYKEDIKQMKELINKKIEQQEYKYNLWS